MKKSNLIRVLTIAACLLFFSNTGYAYVIHFETLSHDTYEDESGDGYTYTSTTDVGEADARAIVYIEDEHSSTYAGAEAYEYRKVYISDYWPNDPTLTATATNFCVAEADALWDTENSEYLIVASSGGYASGCGLSLSCSTQAVVTIYTGTSDTDSDYFEDTADMSFTGATIYFGHSASADAYGFVTSDFLQVEGEGWSETEVVVEAE
jgi:hypothetical protein